MVRLRRREGCHPERGSNLRFHAEGDTQRPSRMNEARATFKDGRGTFKDALG
jgi:hypothetical protein